MAQWHHSPHQEGNHQSAQYQFVYDLDGLQQKNENSTAATPVEKYMYFSWKILGNASCDETHCEAVTSQVYASNYPPQLKNKDHHHVS